MRYYIFGYDATLDDHFCDIYIGEHRPEVPLGDGKELEDFDAVCTFLRSKPVRMVTVFKEPQCPEELVTRIEQWVGANLALHDIGPLELNERPQ